MAVFDKTESLLVKHFLEVWQSGSEDKYWIMIGSGGLQARIGKERS